MPRRRRRRRRGYYVAVLIGLEKSQAHIWNVFKESVKAVKQIKGDGGYSFYEAIVDIIRPSVKQGVKSILVATTDDKDYQTFMNHIRKHQSWLLHGWTLNTVTFEHIPGRAADTERIRDLVNSHVFKEKLSEISQRDIEQVMNFLEKRLNHPEGIETLLFTLVEVENVVFGNELQPEFILMTEEFSSKHRKRTRRLLQIAANKKIKTKIIKKGSPADARIAQFGGLLCILGAREKVIIDV